MPNTYTQIHLQLIFAVKYRAAIIGKNWKDELYKYITGIVQGNKHKLVIINGVENYIHLLIGCRPHQSLSDLMQDIKDILQSGLMKRSLRNLNFSGRKVTEHFLTAIPINSVLLSYQYLVPAGLPLFRFCCA